MSRSKALTLMFVSCLRVDVNEIKGLVTVAGCGGDGQSQPPA